MKIEVLMDHPNGPHVLCPIEDPGAVEDALPEGWTVGWSWCMSPPEALQADGRWLLALMRPDWNPFNADLIVTRDE